MRKLVKPFVTEYKTRKPPTNAAVFNEGTLHDELPSDIDAIVELPDEGHDYQYEEALRAADRVFGQTEPSETAKVGSGTSEKLERTVLSDLSFQDPLEARLAAAAQVKRGRKPGPNNKQKLAPPADAPAEGLPDA